MTIFDDAGTLELLKLWGFPVVELVELFMTNIIRQIIKMQIYISLLNGKTIVIDVQLEKMSVEDLKKKIMEKTGIAIETQILIYQNQVLFQNDKKLSTCFIDKEAKLDLETIQSYIEKFNSQVGTLKQQLMNQKNEMLQQKGQFESQIKALQEQCEIDQKEKSRLTQDLQEQRYENENLKTRQQQIDLDRQKQSTFNMDDANRLQNARLMELQSRVHKLEFEKEMHVQKIDAMEIEKKGLQQRIEELNKIKDEYTEQKFEIRSLKKDIEQIQSTGQQTSGEKEKHLESLKNQLKTYEKQIEEQKKIINQYQEEKTNLEYTKQDLTSSTHRLAQQQDMMQQYEKRISEYKYQIQSLQNQNRELQDQQKSQNNSDQFAVIDLQSQITKLKCELDVKNQAYEESQRALSETRKQVFDQERKIKEQETSIESLKQLMRNKERTIKEKEQEIGLLNGQLLEAKGDMKLIEKQNQTYSRIVQQVVPQAETEHPEIVQTTELLKRNAEKRAREEKELKEKEEKEKQQKLIEMTQEKLQMEELLKKDKQQRQKTAQFLRKQMMDTHGKIEVCFLIDTTASMDPYKEQAMKCISESMKSIKVKTNRDALWSAVAYQDFGELKQLGGLYKQHNFTPNPQEVYNFLKDLPCVGGGDFAEDIRGGIKQMISQLGWSKTFRIAVLICDAPTHGKRYNGGVSDRYPNEDIEDAVKQLIENNILLVGILFNKMTLVMFEEIKKIYKEHDREELLLFADLINTEEGRIWQELVDLVSQASQRATQTNNKGTKTKNKVAQSSSAGAMEALCKMIKNPLEFERHPGVRVENANFKVYRVEIKQDSFESNIENIRKLDIKRDYNTYNEGTWNCIRTQSHFAQGMMKKVYLMKRQNNQNEVYVIKMPLDRYYKSLEEALEECRSHLIAKCLMKKFIRELQEARDRTDRSFRFPEPQYSDFLILEDESRSFWIAERYFQGEFVKYNNNYGFISDENTLLNNLAQAYSYYTYYISNFKYMINDVQGVGLYFTDPALNTKEGSYDETDMGIDGQSMFIVNYEGKRHLGQSFLDLIGIRME